MAVEQPGQAESLQAAADLSDWQFRFVKLDANGQVAKVTANTDQPYGILQDKPAAQGRAAYVMINGISKLVGAANLAKGDFIGTDATGRGEAVAFATANRSIVGTCRTDNSVANGLISVRFDCSNPARS